MSDAKYSAAATSAEPAKKGKLEGCMSGCASFCHHVGTHGDEDGADLYCSQTCNSWGGILGCYTVLYICSFLMTWGLLEACTA
jgi:hypothetical protein